MHKPNLIPSPNVMVFTGNEPLTNRVKEQKPDLDMTTTIVSERDFFSTFSEPAQRNAQNYWKAIGLYKAIKNCSEIARQIGQPNRTVAEWLSEGKMPHAVLAREELKRNRLLPLVLDEKSDRFMLFVELFGFVYGDGTLKKDLFGAGFCGQESDLITLKRRLDALTSFGSSIIPVVSNSTVRKLVNGVIYEKKVSGTAYALRLHSSQLAKLLYLAGATKGDKASQAVTVPDWLMNSPKEIKRRFLSVLFANEVQCPYIRTKNAFSAPQLGFHKIEEKESDLFFFLQQIRTLLSEFGVSTSPPTVDDSYKTLRKDGKLSKKIYVSIDSHSPNLVRLFREIPFPYCAEKQQRFVKATEQFLKNSRHLKTEWEIYEKVIQMHDSGLGRRTIFKKLGLPKPYFYKINAWIHYGNKPLYYEEKEFLSSFQIAK